MISGRQFITIDICVFLFLTTSKILLVVCQVSFIMFTGPNTPIGSMMNFSMSWIQAFMKSGLHITRGEGLRAIVLLLSRASEGLPIIGLQKTCLQLSIHHLYCFFSFKRPVFLFYKCNLNFSDFLIKEVVYQIKVCFLVLTQMCKIYIYFYQCAKFYLTYILGMQFCMFL